MNQVDVSHETLKEHVDQHKKLTYFGSSAMYSLSLTNESALIEMRYKLVPN